MYVIMMEKVSSRPVNLWASRPPNVLTACSVSTAANAIRLRRVSSLSATATISTASIANVKIPMLELIVLQAIRPLLPEWGTLAHPPDEPV